MSPFWSGFAVAAVLFSIIGSAIGIILVALLCQVKQRQDYAPGEHATDNLPLALRPARRRIS